MRLFALVRNPLMSLCDTCGPDFFNNMEHSYNVAGNEDPKAYFFNNQDSKFAVGCEDEQCHCFCRSRPLEPLCCLLLQLLRYVIS